MKDVNCEWIMKEMFKVKRVNQIINSFKLFEPTKEFYNLLASGEQNDLENATNIIANHISLPNFPKVKYDWSLSISIDAIGQIKNSGTEISEITIPFSIVGKPYIIGATLAHEISHQLLALNNVYYKNLDENEKLTDFTSIAVGLGSRT